jgi:hypothetical protein
MMDMSDLRMYDPLDYENLARNIADELMRRRVYQLPPEQRFDGAGIYAIFYNGNFKPYVSVCSPDWTKPIYVGKAVVTGSRKGQSGRLIEPLNDTGPYLYNRLCEHAESIKSVSNLDLSDFSLSCTPHSSGLDSNSRAIIDPEV